MVPLLILIDASRIHKKPAAIHNVDELGMKKRASELKIAPTKKYGRLLPRNCPSTVTQVTNDWLY